MRVEELPFPVNPLIELWEYIDTICNIPLTNKHIENIANIFNKGGVYPETQAEAITLIELFNSFYGLIEIVVEDSYHYIRKTDGKDMQQT